MMVFSILLFAFIVILSAVYTNIYNMREAVIEREAFAFVDNVRTKINTVYLEGDGFSLNLSLPEKFTVVVTEKAEIFSYDLIIDRDSLLLDIPEFRSYRRSLLTENVSGMLNKGDNLISNVKGVVVIS